LRLSALAGDIPNSFLRSMRLILRLRILFACAVAELWLTPPAILPRLWPRWDPAITSTARRRIK